MNLTIQKAASRPDFLIIGAQKCGTTSLHFYLDQHPQLQGSEPKEVHYFDQWRYQGKDLDWYEAHFKRGDDQKDSLFFESTPKYLYHPEAAKHIAALYPDIKLIVLLRNPVDRAFSAWNFYNSFYVPDYQDEGVHLNNPVNTSLFYTPHQSIQRSYYEGKNSFPDLKTLIDIELMLPDDKDEPSTLRRGLYAKQLQNCYQYFNKEQIMIIGFRDLIESTQAILQQIYDFLDVSHMPFDKIDLSKKNAVKHKSDFVFEEKEFLENYYAEANEELVELLGYQPNW